jgi:hypothetical protein
MRDKFTTITITLDSAASEQELLTLIPTLPIDKETPLQVCIRELVHDRTLEQNKLYHAIIADMADQLWIDKKRYLPDVWSHYMKELYLPEFPESGITRAAYKKWMVTLTGERILSGSTTDLKIKGMTEFISKVTLYAAEHSVVFTDQING